MCKDLCKIWSLGGGEVWGIFNIVFGKFFSPWDNEIGILKLLAILVSIATSANPSPQESATKMITNCRTCHPFPLLLNSSLHVELIPKARPTESKQRQQTPPYRKAVYQVLRAKFLTSQENRRKATVAQAAKKLTATLAFSWSTVRKKKHWPTPKIDQTMFFYYLF